MGVIQGRCSLTSYHVIDLKAPLSIQQLDECLSAHAAKDIRLQGVSKPLLYGWAPAPIAEIEGSDQWSVSDAQINGGIMLRARIEKRNIPASLIQLCVKQKLNALTKRREKPLGRKERRELLQETKTELIMQALPQISYVDAFLNAAQDQLLVFSTSKQARLVIEDLFAKTFGRTHGAKIVRLPSPLMALAPEDWADLDSKFMQRLSLTVPTPIIEHRT